MKELKGHENTLSGHVRSDYVAPFFEAHAVEQMARAHARTRRIECAAFQVLT